jgi:hypothetical protein
MNGGSDWYNGIVQKINGLKNTLNQKYYRWYKLDSLTPGARLTPLSSAARRIDQFSPDCEQCTAFRDDVDRLISNAPDVSQKDDKELLGSFLNDIDGSVAKMTGHFRKEHKLVTEGFYKSLFAAAGAVIGMVIAFVVIPYNTVWVIVGAGAGLVVGAILDAKIKKEDRILYQQTSRRLSNTSWTLLILLGIAVLAVLMAAFLLCK